MAKPDWKNEIGSCFDDLRILEKCQAEVDAQFAHFYESVAEPAFQGLADEFKRHKVRCAFARAKENRIKLDRDDLAYDVVARYKRFVTEAALAPEGATETP